MRLFRRGLDLSRATVRLANEADLPRVSRLFRDGARRYYGMTGGDLHALLAASQGVLIESGVELWAVTLAGWLADHTTWLRGMALAEGLDVPAGLGLLLSSLHDMLQARDVRRVYYAGDEASDPWLIPALQQQGYVLDTDVIVYEKRDLEMPSQGNTEIRVRPALPVDLATVVALDRICFEAQWTKDDTILGPAIDQGPLFVVAEKEARVIGYAYATSHFNGRLVHLVRIAVHPRLQNQAIGVRLLAEVVSFARKRQAYTITLNTQAYNVHAQRLYRWFGFVPTGERQSVLRCDM